MNQQNNLKLGDYNAICDVCGFKYKASQLKQRWDGLMVCREDWESRHISDFYRARGEDTSVPFSRPDTNEAVWVGDLEYPLQGSFLGRGDYEFKFEPGTLTAVETTNTRLSVSNGNIITNALNRPLFYSDSARTKMGFVSGTTQTNDIQNYTTPSTWSDNSGVTVTDDAGYPVVASGSFQASKVIFNSTPTSKVATNDSNFSFRSNVFWGVFLKADVATTARLYLSDGTTENLKEVSIGTEWKLFSQSASGTFDFYAILGIQNNSAGTTGTIYMWNPYADSGAEISLGLPCLSTFSSPAVWYAVRQTNDIPKNNITIYYEIENFDSGPLHSTSSSTFVVTAGATTVYTGLSSTSMGLGITGQTTIFAAHDGASVGKIAVRLSSTLGAAIACNGNLTKNAGYTSDVSHTKIKFAGDSNIVRNFKVFFSDFSDADMQSITTV